MKISDVILGYLDNTYYICSDKIVAKYNDDKIYCSEVTKLVSIIFDVHGKVADKVIKRWLRIFFRNEDIFQDFFRNSFFKHRTHAMWEPKMVTDNLCQYILDTDTEDELVHMLSNAINDEIDREILDRIFKLTSDSNEILKYVKYIENERENNINWNNWIRSTRQNE